MAWIVAEDLGGLLKVVLDRLHRRSSSQRLMDIKDYDGVMGLEDIEAAERFRVALEAAVRTNDRESVYTLLAPDVEWVTPKRTLRGIDEMRREWTWGSSPESFDYEFEKGDWVDDGDGRLSCDVREIYRLKDTGDFAYSRRRRIQLTIHEGKIARYEMVG